MFYPQMNADFNQLLHYKDLNELHFENINDFDNDKISELNAVIPPNTYCLTEKFKEVTNRQSEQKCQ